jgi:hypothetical protein
VRKMGRRGRPEVLALQLPQGPEQLTVTNLGPASKLLQEGGQERVTLQHIQRAVAFLAAGGTAARHLDSLMRPTRLMTAVKKD